jgi:hypothetical protein
MRCCDLLRELRHLSAASWTDRTHHVATLSSLFHCCLVIWHCLLLLTFHAEHFSQSLFPPYLNRVSLSG